MSDDLFNLSIREIIRSKLLEVHTLLPGEIVKVYPNGQTVDVQILIKRQRNKQGKRVLEDIDVLKDVPISYPRVRDYSLTMPIQVGDECMLQFMERSIDNWLLDGGKAEMGDLRHHSFSDAVAIVGLWNRTNPVKEYNVDQPEFRTDDAQKKVWLDKENDTGWVEMVDLNEDSRVVLKANGEVRAANDAVKTMMEIYPDTKIQIKNPLAKTRMDKFGDILMQNPLISRQMDKFGDIEDKTILGKQQLKKSGEKFFKNLIAKQITKASGKIEYKCLLNKFDMQPSGITKLGNAINKLKIDPVQSTLGSALNKLKVNPAISSLGNPLASLKVLPTSVLLQDAGGVVTPALVTALTSAVSSIASSLGLNDIVDEIGQQLFLVNSLVDSLPQDDISEEEDIFDSVEDTITNILINEGVDLLSKEAENMLNSAIVLDKAWDDDLFDELIANVTEVIGDG